VGKLIRVYRPRSVHRGLPVRGIERLGFISEAQLLRRSVGCPMDFRAAIHLMPCSFACRLVTRSDALKRGFGKGVKVVRPNFLKLEDHCSHIDAFVDISLEHAFILQTLLYLEAVVGKVAASTADNIAGPRRCGPRKSQFALCLNRHTGSSPYLSCSFMV
jgi:hypothetical protein